MGRRLVIKAGEHQFWAVVYEVRSMTLHNPLFFIHEL